MAKMSKEAIEERKAEQAKLAKEIAEAEAALDEDSDGDEESGEEEGEKGKKKKGGKEIAAISENTAHNLIEKLDKVIELHSGSSRKGGFFFPW